MRLISTAVLAALAANLAAPAAFADPGDVVLSASLSGKMETPPNAEVGTGMFHANVNPDTGRLCYTLTSENLASRTMAHIHVGAPGVAGPPVVFLKPDMPAQDCLSIDPALAAKLVASPGDYYVNIHSAMFPKGAIRGQLMK